MSEALPTPQRTCLGLVIVASLLNVLSLLWYGSQVVQFGFGFDLLDLIGGYLLVNCFAVVTVLGIEAGQVGKSRFHFVICALGIFASVLFLGQFLSTFDPHYRVNDRLFSYLLRGLLLAATVTSLLSLGPGRFLRVPRWLLAGVGLVAAGWLFVYACPSIVREWYGTRTEPSEMFPKGVLWFTRSNPERDIQEQMLYAFVAAWLVMIVVGRIRNRRAANQAARQTMED